MSSREEDRILRNRALEGIAMWRALRATIASSAVGFARARGRRAERKRHSYNYAEKRYSGGNHQSSAVHILASMLMDESRSGQRRIVRSRLSHPSKIQLRFGEVSRHKANGEASSIF